MIATMKMQMQKLSVQEMLDNEAKEYNESEWRKKVLRYARFDDCQFYLVPKDEVYSYDRFFVKYGLPNGEFFCFASFGYSSSLTSASFTVVEIDENGLLTVPDKNMRFQNDKFGRFAMSQASRMIRTIFTTEF